MSVFSRRAVHHVEPPAPPQRKNTWIVELLRANFLLETAHGVG
jgi:hypothetical protein